MAAKRQRRNYVRRPDLGIASAALGCNYSHLRRVVIRERKTPLLARYRTWKAAHRASKRLLKRAAREVNTLQHNIHTANQS